MKSDFEYQADYVINRISELLYCTDMNILSKTYGCAHLAYWRDKTSELADVRRQEFVLTLALLYKYEFKNNIYYQDKTLLNHIEALLTFWTSIQYPDGSFDEWYKGERAFAGAAFTCFAVAKTLLEAGDFLASDIKIKTGQTLKKTADWLISRDDLFKTNHQAVGVCALAYCYKYFNEKKYLDNSYKKLESILAVQTARGWFPEVGGMDIGYTFVTIDYLCMAFEILNDYSKIASLIKAFDFACKFIQPDITVGNEIGICHNPYISRIAIIFMRERSEYAGWLFRYLSENNTGFKGISPIIADELRLSRWSYLPLLAFNFLEKLKITKADKLATIPLADFNSSYVNCFENEKLITFSNKKNSGLFAPIYGGMIKVFSKAGAGLTDYGYIYKLENISYTNSYYNKNAGISKTSENSFEIKIDLIKPDFFFPSFFSRLVLRILCSTAFGSKWTRKMIDVIRKKKGSALNQSSSGNASDKGSITLTRKITITDYKILVSDIIESAYKLDIKNIIKHQSCNDIIEEHPDSSGILNNSSKAPHNKIEINYSIQELGGKLKKVF